MLFSSFIEGKISYSKLISYSVNDLLKKVSVAQKFWNFYFYSATVFFIWDFIDERDEEVFRKKFGEKKLEKIKENFNEKSNFNGIQTFETRIEKF